MVFSTMLLVLWYFKAEMSTISLLGNSIKFTANTHNLWLVLAVANTYFFCRYIQHLPSGWNKLTSDFDVLYQATLCRITKTFYRRRIHAAAWADFEGDQSVAGVSDFRVQPAGYLLSPRNLVTEKFDFSPKQAKVIFQMPTTWVDPDGGKCESTGVSTVIAPHVVLVVLSRAISFVKGLYLTPWFTEHLFPMLYAACAIGVGFWSWHTADVRSANAPSVDAHSSSVVHPVQTSIQATPDVFGCMSVIIQAKQSMLSVPCVPVTDIAGVPLPLVLRAAPSASG
ncbi:hypothetical protein [Pseudomonas sp.]|uniref:hypothetical protein n=1 Tax=Pseudomonas sp. TaxID=306 RepID=UPI0028A8F7A8|nr:hypothetical protein [Pseudomonas sp.]